jgi:hypothetical protein
MSKHSNSQKHIRKYISKQSEITDGNDKRISKLIKYKMFCKLCNKEYRSRVGLWRHKKICRNTEVENIVDDEICLDTYEEENNSSFTIQELNTTTNSLAEENKIISMFVNQHQEYEEQKYSKDCKENIDDFKTLILEVLKSNNELQKQNTE